MLWSYHNAKISVDYEIREFTQKECESSFNLYNGRKFLSKFLMLTYEIKHDRKTKYHIKSCFSSHIHN